MYTESQVPGYIQSIMGKEKQPQLNLLQNYPPDFPRKSARSFRNQQLSNEDRNHYCYW